MAQERTLGIVKPDAVGKGLIGKVIAHLEECLRCGMDAETYAAIKRAKGDWDRRVGVFRKLEGLEARAGFARGNRNAVGQAG